MMKALRGSGLIRGLPSDYIFCLGLQLRAFCVPCLGPFAEFELQAPKMDLGCSSGLGF